MSNHYQIEEFFNSSLGRASRRRSPAKRPPRWWQRWRSCWPSKSQWRFLPRVLSAKERRLVSFLTLAVIVLFIAWMTALSYQGTITVPDFGGTYVEGSLGEPKYINPLLAQASDVDRDLTALIFSSLLKYDSRGELQPDLAEIYEVSGDGLEYLFRLKNNLQWHDGFPLTADDVVFTVRLIQNNDYGSPQRINWQGVEIEKVDDQTVKIRLRAKYAQFLNNVTLGILPKHLWGNIQPAQLLLTDFNLRPIGSGPYKFKRLKKDNQGSVISYELEAFEQYYFHPPYIKKLIFKFYPSEEILVDAYNRNETEGLGLISPPQLENLKFPQRLKIQEIDLPRYFSAFFNQNQSVPLADKNVRLALNYGTDKERLVKEVLAGYGLTVNSPLLKELGSKAGRFLSRYAYDSTFAKQILDNSQWKDKDQDGFREKDDLPLALEIKTLNWPELLKVAEILQKDWERLGFKITRQIETLPEIQQSIKNRNYEVLIFGEVLNLDPDPYSFWHSSQKKDPGLNLALYDNKSADKILEESRQLLNPLERKQKYEDFEKILLEDAPAVFLYSPAYLYPVSKKIKGNDFTILAIPSARFNNVNEWYIETKRTKKSE